MSKPHDQPVETERNNAAGVGRRFRVHVHLDWGRSPERWSELYRAGAVIDADPYGYRALAPWVDLHYSVDHHEGPVVRLLRRGSKYVLGFDVLHGRRNLASILAADYVITHTEYEYLAILLLLVLRRDDSVKVVCQSVWLWDRWRRYSPWRKAFLRALLRRGTVHTVHSPANLAVAQAVLSEQPVRLVPFGIGLLDAIPSRATRSLPPKPVRVLALGNDRDRDWKLLGDAVDRMASVEVRVRSHRRAAKRIARPRITVDVNRTVEEYRRDLAWCDVVVIPLRENTHASGVTVLLEAVSAGRPVVAADTGGLRFYANDWVTFYKPGDAIALGEAITGAATWDADRPTGRTAVEAAGFTARDYALRHAVLIDWIEGDDPIGDTAIRRPVDRAIDPIGATEPDRIDEGVHETPQ